MRDWLGGSVPQRICTDGASARQGGRSHLHRTLLVYGQLEGARDDYLYTDDGQRHCGGAGRIQLVLGAVIGFLERWSVSETIYFTFVNSHNRLWGFSVEAHYLADDCLGEGYC
jgi:hypothetical protein